MASIITKRLASFLHYMLCKQRDKNKDSFETQFELPSPPSKACQPARMKKDEQAVQDLNLCMDSFNADPFDESVSALGSLQYSVIASPEVLQDLQNVLEKGEYQSNDILEEPVFSKELSLKATITKSRKLNLATTPINNTKTCSNAMEMERNAFATVVVSAQKNDVIVLESVFFKRFSEESLTMFNVNGSMRKIQKEICFSHLQDSLCFKFLQHTSGLLIWGLSGDLYPQHLKIVMQRHVVEQTTYGVITSVKCAR